MTTDVGANLAAMRAQLNQLLREVRKANQRFLGINDAGNYSGLSSKSIRRLLASGKLTSLRPVRGRVLVDRVELDALVLSSTAAQRKGRGWISKANRGGGLTPEATTALFTRLKLMEVRTMAEPKRQSTGAHARVKPSPDVVDLRKLAGRRYQVEFEPAYAADHGKHTKIDDPWLLIVPGKRGHIYPYGGDLLAVSTNSRGPVANQLSALPYCEVKQDGDDGVTLVFHWRHFHEIAKRIGARGRRVLSEAERSKLLADGAASRFKRRRPDEGASAA